MEGLLPNSGTQNDICVIAIVFCLRSLSIGTWREEKEDLASLIKHRMHERKL